MDGRNVPHGEAAVFPFVGLPYGAENYRFSVRQTYSDDSVVSWSGPEGSDNPAAAIDAKSSLGGGGSSTLAVIALILAAVAILVGLAASSPAGKTAGGPYAREPPPLPPSWRRLLRCLRPPSASRARPDRAEAVATLNAPPPVSRSSTRRRWPARFLDRLGHRVAGRQVTAAHHAPEQRCHARDTASGASRKVYLVFWRVISADGPGPGAHLRRRPEPGSGAGVRDPELSETADDTTASDCALDRLRRATGSSRPLRPPGDDRAASVVAGAGAVAPARDDRLLRVHRASLIAVPVYIDLTTAQFALRSVFDLGDIVPLARASRFGRALINLEIATALSQLPRRSRLHSTARCASKNGGHSYSRSGVRSAPPPRCYSCQGWQDIRPRRLRAAVARLDWLHRWQARSGSAA